MFKVTIGKNKTPICLSNYLRAQKNTSKIKNKTKTANKQNKIKQKDKKEHLIQKKIEITVKGTKQRVRTLLVNRWCLNF